MNYLSLFRIISLSAIMIMAIALQTHIIISGDITWLMHVGKNFLAGGHYYTDFIEVNPPMAIYIYLIPVILSQLLSISFITSITIYIFCVAMIAWLVCSYLLNKIFAPADSAIHYFFETMLTFALFVLPAYAFGQREYLLVTLILPYLLLAVLRLQKQTLNKVGALLIGIAAGIGFTIKPFFLFAWLFIELYLALRTKSIKLIFRSETISCLALFLIYALSIVLVTPEYIKQTELLIQPTYYFNFHVPFSLLLINNLVIFGVILLIIFGLTRKTLKYQALGDLLAVSIISMLVNFLLQQTLWFYHIFPVLFFSTLLLALTATSYIQANNPFKFSAINWPFFRESLKFLALCFLVIYIFFVTFSNIKVGFYLTKVLFNNPIYRIAKSARGQPIYIFTNNIATNYPLIDYADTYSPSAFPCLWLINAAHKLEQQDKTTAKQQQAAQIANFVRAKDIDNIIKYKPLFIFVQNKDNFMVLNRNFLFTYSYKVEQLPTFDFLGFFLQDPTFARYWQNYHYQGQAGTFAVYELK